MAVGKVSYFSFGLEITCRLRAALRPAGPQEQVLPEQPCDAFKQYNNNGLTLQPSSLFPVSLSLLVSLVLTSNVLGMSERTFTREKNDGEREGSDRKIREREMKLLREYVNGFELPRLKEANIRDVVDE